MADVLVFEPADFEVLETFDYEEEVQKPEETRFFTLDAQLTDFFEKTLPKGKATKFEIKEIRTLKDRLKTAYETLIVATESDYIINSSRTSLNVPWVTPVYSEFELKNYNYGKEWEPIFKQKRVPNYYSRLIGALPRPYTSTEDGRLLDKTSRLVNSEGKLPIIGLGNYLTTKIILKDDGTFDTISAEIAQTSDEIKTIGFYLDERPELPRPLMDHPFLKSNKPSFLKTDVSLLDSFPSVSAIMEHAIPVTTDPYSASGILKLYDIKMSQIPWVSWKDRFPPVERQDVPMPIKELTFSKEKPDEPGDSLTKTYHIPWSPGYDSRLWLSKQVDGGYFVSRILLSEASASGSLAASPFADVPVASFPESNPEICMNLMSNFDSFLSSGLYRSGHCIPISTILQEKITLAYKDRKVWKEATKHEILTEYQKLLKTFQIEETVEKDEKYPKFEHLIKSERHRDALVIQEDPKREPEDKADALEKIVRDLTLENRKYYDVPGQFVLCLHTIEILRGALEDRFKFYAEWTVSVDGNRVCRFCGESINSDTFVAVKEYDEDGHLTAEYSAIETVVHTDNFVNSLAELKKLFNPENAGESLLFTILTFLQVLPDEKQLLPLLQLIRKLSAGLKARAATSKAIAKEKQELVEGSLGIAAAVVLLQAHNPLLVPKRSIGNRPLNTTGYPRDSDNPEECFVLGSILVLLRKTFESFPGSYRGSVATILREVLKQSKTLKEQSLQWIKFFTEQFKPLFEAARERYEAPEAEAPKNDIVLPIETVNNPIYNPGESLDNEKQLYCKVKKTTSVWHTKRPHIVSQDVLELQSKIEPSPASELVEPINKPLEFVNVSDKDIRKRVGLGLPNSFTAFSEFVKYADGAAYVTVTSRILSILSTSTLAAKEQKVIRDGLYRIDILESDSMIRDIAKGYFFELMGIVKAHAPLSRLLSSALQNDLTLKMALLSKDVAEKEDFELKAKERNTLKASLRSMNDMERDLTRRLLDLGIAEFIITNVDRERFVRELNYKEPELEDDEARDYVENGDQPIAADGAILEVDYGDYGDRTVRDYNDYTPQQTFDDESL